MNRALIIWAIIVTIICGGSVITAKLRPDWICYDCVGRATDVPDRGPAPPEIIRI